MGKDNTPAANAMIDLIRDLIVNELAKQDTTAVCKIISSNNDGSYNIVVFPDAITLISGVKSISPENFKAGEYAYIYKFRNKLNNAVIFAKIGGEADDLKFVKTENLEQGVYSSIVKEATGSGGGGDGFPSIVVTSLTTPAEFTTGTNAWINVRIESGQIQVGDEIVICARKNSTRSSDQYKRRRYKTLKTVIVENISKNIFSIPISFDSDRDIYRGGNNPNRQTGPVTRYIKLRRVNADRTNATFSNIVQITIMYSPTYHTIGLY